MIMKDRDAFERMLASLYDAMLDDRHWPATSALIDEICGSMGSALFIGEGPKDDQRLHLVGLFYRGHRRTDLEREYLEDYHPTNEAVPRALQLPEGHLVQMQDLFTPEEQKTSRAYNEFLLRASFQNGLNALLEGPGGSALTWSLADPVTSDGWRSSQIAMVRRLTPHIRQFVRVRQALAHAHARGATETTLLDSPHIGVLHLDRRGRIMEANDRASAILRRGDALVDRDGVPYARAPEDRLRLERLLAAALATSGAIAVSGSMPLRRSSVLPPLVVHVKPVAVLQPHFGARSVAALVLIVEPGRPRRVDPGTIAMALGLTPGESQVAVWLAQGMSVRQMAQATGHSDGAIYWHLKQMYQKLHVSRQTDLVRLVLSIAEPG